jgi:hypothetical protein
MANTYPAPCTILLVLDILWGTCFAFFSSLHDPSPIQTSEIGIPTFPALYPFLSRWCNRLLGCWAVKPTHGIARVKRSSNRWRSINEEGCLNNSLRQSSLPFRIRTGVYSFAFPKHYVLVFTCGWMWCPTGNGVFILRPMVVTSLVANFDQTHDRPIAWEIVVHFFRAKMWPPGLWCVLSP